MTAYIIDGAFVKVSSSVLLGFHGGRQFKNDHLNESISGVDPLLEDVLHLVFALEFLLVVLENDFKSLEHLVDGLVVAFHAVLAESDDRLHDELDEASLEC